MRRLYPVDTPIGLSPRLAARAQLDHRLELVERHLLRLVDPAGELGLRNAQRLREVSQAAELVHRALDRLPGRLYVPDHASVHVAYAEDRLGLLVAFAGKLLQALAIDDAHVARAV